MLWPADADLVRRDPALPGLALLFDPEGLVDALRRLLPHADLEGARLSYLRYKPGTNCLGAYEVRAAGQAVPVHAKVYRPEDRAPLHKAQGLSSVPGPLGRGRIILPDAAAVVSIFPNDDALPSLARTAGDEPLRRLLGRLFRGHPDLCEGTLRGLHYKPERRYVAQFLVGQVPRAVLKFYTEVGFAAANNSSWKVEAGGPLRLARRLGRSRRHRVLAQEWLPGRLLSQALADPAVDLAPVGAALAALHAWPGLRLTPRPRQAEAETLLAAARALCFLCPHLAGRIDDLARRLAACLAGLPAVDRPIHGDFYANQVLLTGDGVALLDFDGAVCGDPAADLGTFLAHLHRHALGGAVPPGRVGPVEDALLAGYRAATGRPLPDRVGLYTAAGLLGLARHPFRDHRPDWPEQVEALVERAEAIARAQR